MSLGEPVAPLAAGDVVQVVGFRGQKQLRLLPLGGLPVVAHYELVIRTGLPCGSPKPPHGRRFHRRRPEKLAPAPAARTFSPT